MLKFFDPLWWEIRRQKKSEDLLPLVPDNPTGPYGRIIARGQGFFYKDKSKCLICDIAFLPDEKKIYLVADSVKRWSNGRKVSGEDKIKIINQVKSFLYRSSGTSSFNRSQVIVCDKNGSEVKH